MADHPKFKALEAILSQLPGHIYWEDCNGVILGCNAAQARSAGFSSKEEMIGKTDYEMPWKERADEITAVNRKVIEEGMAVITREEVNLPDGKRIVYRSEKIPRYNEYGEVIGILGISINITEQVELEESLASEKKRANEMLDRYKEFVSNQEHDMITPYTGIVDASELLIEILEEGGGPEVEVLAKNINLGGQGLLNYQQSLLDAIYLFNDETELYHRRFEFWPYIESIADMFLCSLQKKSLKFSIHVDKTIPKFLLGDNFRLRNCLVRLLSNAVKYTESGEIKLNCYGQATAKENEILLDIQVEDTGIGIEEGKLEVIFEPFTRLTLSNIGKYEGRGVGLAFVKKMMEELHGEVDMSSELGKGSVFRLVLPMQRSLTQQPTPKPTGKKKNS